MATLYFRNTFASMSPSPAPQIAGLARVGPFSLGFCPAAREISQQVVPENLRAANF
jgi:hypothetical protein